MPEHPPLAVNPWRHQGQSASLGAGTRLDNAGPAKHGTVETFKLNISSGGTSWRPNKDESCSEWIGEHGGACYKAWHRVAHIGCPRIIRTCSFSRFSPLRWNRWCCGFQNFQNYSSGVKAKRHTLPKSAYYSVQSLDQVSVGESFFPFCSKTKQATRYWQEAQPRLPQQTHWHDICWRA